jgi:antitoxin CptB
MDDRQKRLRLRCWRRGMREVDLILGPWADASAPELTEDGLAAAEALLEEADQDIYAWVAGSAAPPGRHSGIIGALQRFHGGRI